jgi:hypothetical protein
VHGIGISLGDAWIGVSATAGSARFDVTHKEYQGAQSEALAVAKVLRTAHAEFTGLRKKVEQIREDAVRAGMRVSERGVVAFGTAQLEPGEYQAYVHDPSYQESARKAAAEWAAQLAVAVQVVNDADEDFKLTLAALMQDSNLPDGTISGFNREPPPQPLPVPGTSREGAAHVRVAFARPGFRSLQHRGADGRKPVVSGPASRPAATS